jgi:cell division protein FtsB
LLEIGVEAGYVLHMNAAVKSILERVAAWPEEDQEELAALAREIEARRTGVYQLSDGEKAAIDAARRSALASDDGVAAFWKRYGLG